MKRWLYISVLAVMLAVTFCGSSACAAIGPFYDIHAIWGDTNLTPGDSKTTTAEGQFVVQVRNIGDTRGTEETLTIEDNLPMGVVATGVDWSNDQGDFGSLCGGIGTSEVKCTLDPLLVPKVTPPPGASAGTASAEPSGDLATLYVDVSVPKNASGSGTNIATVRGGGAPSAVSDSGEVSFSKVRALFGLAPNSFLADFFTGEYPFGDPDRLAGSRPFEFRTRFGISARSGVNDGLEGDVSRYITSTGQVRTVEVRLPRGVIGNPEAIPKCLPVDFAARGATNSSTMCPPDTQVGYLNIQITEGTRNHGKGGPRRTVAGRLNRVPIYNLVPPKGRLADFGIGTILVQAHIYPTLDPAHNYSIKTVSPNISSFVQVRGTEVTIWGVPGDSAHNKFRARVQKNDNDEVLGAPWGSKPIRPFLTNPSDCGEKNEGAAVRMDSYEHPEVFTDPVESPGIDVVGCEDARFQFDPSLTIEPTSKAAGAATGLDVDLRLPQQNDEAVSAEELYADSGSEKAITTPPIKKVVVGLPSGVTISPAAADGLATCSEAEINLNLDVAADCPNAAQIGTLTLKSPALPQDEVVSGRVYVANQIRNPFGSFLALYLVIEDPNLGLRVKLPGRIDLDSATGQVSTTFENLPQLPVSTVQIHLKGGDRAPLVNSGTCGPQTTTAEFYSWQDPSTSHKLISSYYITQRQNGGLCVQALSARPFKPQLSAGTVDNAAGSYSPFLMRVIRGDDDQELSRLKITLPGGLTGKLAGVDDCPEGAIARAMGRTAIGQGIAELSAPSCPVSSRVGATQVGTGVGTALTYVPGVVYLAGPYQGAPLSAIVITPGIVGPFDVGVVAIRTALRLNPETAQVTAVSDSLPQLIHGIPVRIRDLRVNLDRSQFTLNPTSCAEKQTDAAITGTGGDLVSAADDSEVSAVDRFQAANCRALKFRPALSLVLFGPSHRGAHPRFRAVLKARPGDANIAGASVALPHSVFLDQAHIGTVCTRLQFAATQCPSASVYGHAIADTPLFDQPLEGPVYLRSSSHKLPDLVALLRGPVNRPVEVVLDGRVDSVSGGIRNTFEVVPDAPVSTFTLTMRGGSKGLLVN